MNIFWFIPTHGDSRYLGTSRGARAVDFDYARQVAQAADRLGYEGAKLFLLATGVFFRSTSTPITAFARWTGA